MKTAYPKSIDAVAFLALHDRFSIMLGLIGYIALTPLAVVSILWLLALAQLAKVILKRDGYTHPDLAVSLDAIPERTFFVPYSSVERHGWRWILKKFSDYAAISVPGLNVILYRQETVRLDRTGFAKARLLHELGHCGHWDAFFVLIAVVFSLHFIRHLLTAISVPTVYDGQLLFFPVVYFLIGLGVLVALSRVIHRREFVADHYAYTRQPDLYLKYLQVKAAAIPMKVEGTSRRVARHAGEIASIWHPSWEQRLAVILDRYRINGLHVFFTTFLYASFASLVLASLFIPRRATILYQHVSGPFPWFAILGALSAVLAVFWLGRLIHTAVTRFPPQLSAPAVVGYAIGPPLGLLCLMLTEEYFLDAGYHPATYWIPTLVFVPFVSITTAFALLGKRWNFREVEAACVAVAVFLSCVLFASLILVVLAHDDPLRQVLSHAGGRPIFLSFIAAASLIASVAIVAIYLALRLVALVTWRRFRSHRRPKN